MNSEDGKTNGENEGAPLGAANGAPRKPYAPPRLRSLGGVNAITLAASTLDEGAKKKPVG
jgi:hypothetical protein